MLQTIPMVERPLIVRNQSIEVADKANQKVRLFYLKKNLKPMIGLKSNSLKALQAIC